MGKEYKSLGQELGLEEPSESLGQCLTLLKEITSLERMSQFYPVSPQERLAWWIKVAEIYHKSWTKSSKEKAKKSVAVVRRVARETKLKIPNSKEFKFLTYYKT